MLIPNYDTIHWAVDLFKADAKECFKEWHENDLKTPDEMVEYAKDESTELHKCFDWDDPSAAHKWRKQQARNIMSNLKVEWMDSDDAESETITIRAIHNINDPESGESVYKETKVILENPDERRQLFEKAKQDMRTFKENYNTIKELKAVFDEMDKLL